MGILNLLKEIKGKQINLSDFKNQSIVIDGHCLVHRACVLQPESLMFKKDVTNVVNYLKKVITEIIQCTQSIVILVFDGHNYPLKIETDEIRQQHRQQFLRQYQEIVEQDPQQAQKILQQAFSVTFDQVIEISKQLAKHFENNKQLNLIVAPYEGDAQTAFITLSKYADVVISVDSDLLLYGVPKLICHFDPNDMSGTLYTQESVQEAFPGMTQFQFVMVCVLSGCDYLRSYQSIGLKRAACYLQKNQFNVKNTIAEIAKTHQHDLSVEQYYNRFIRAVLNYKYQVILNPLTKQLENLCAVDENVVKAGVEMVDFGLKTMNFDELFVVWSVQQQKDNEDFRRFDFKKEFGLE